MAASILDSHSIKVHIKLELKVLYKVHRCLDFGGGIIKIIVCKNMESLVPSSNTRSLDKKNQCVE